MTLVIDRIDHVVINCRDVETTAAWYEKVLGMTREEFGPQRRVALKFGQQKFNVRPVGASDWWTAATEAPGTLDLCFVTRQSPQEVMAHLQSCDVTVAEGPVTKTGALGPITSVYCRDPDGSLIEISSYPRE